MGVIQWFPGHMAKARRILAENLSNVDVVVELCDARIPYSSRNPEIVKVIGKKPSVMVCNKADLADPVMSDFWKTYYRKQGIEAVFTDSRKGEGVKKVTAAIKNAMAEKIRRQEEKGRVNAQIRAMIVGIPNVGKSSFINRVAGKAVAVTGDKPGVTRSKQWLKMASDIYLLDTPGLLWPKIEDQRCGYRLACTGAIKEDILDNTDIACFLLDFLQDIRKRCGNGLRYLLTAAFWTEWSFWSSAGESGAVW
jgi:ribosome biogenesis GTPase A